MSDLLLPGIVLALSLGLTWRFCLRPMAKGQHCGSAGSRPQPAAQSGKSDEVARLRGEIGELREELLAQRRGAAES